MLGAGIMLPGMEVACCVAASFGKNACSALESILITNRCAGCSDAASGATSVNAVAGSQHAEHSSTRELSHAGTMIIRRYERG